MFSTFFVLGVGWMFFFVFFDIFYYTVFQYESIFKDRGDVLDLVWTFSFRIF